MNSAYMFMGVAAAASRAERALAAIGDINDRTVCRWCLRKFDPAQQQPRTTAERGALRTRLHMADNGSELVICDNCWPGAMGHAHFVHGQAVPCADPTVVPNLLLRQSEP